MPCGVPGPVAALPGPPGCFCEERGGRPAEQKADAISDSCAVRGVAMAGRPLPGRKPRRLLLPFLTETRGAESQRSLALAITTRTTLSHVYQLLPSPTHPSPRPHHKQTCALSCCGTSGFTISWCEGRATGTTRGLHTCACGKGPV